MRTITKQRSPAVAVAIFVIAASVIVSAPASERFPFDVELVEVEIHEMPGLHSFAFAQHEGRWLLIGGRLDGLHARQPMRSFPSADNNTDIYLVDPIERRVRSVSVLDLPAPQAEQLQSTNMNFHQAGETLFIMGGYGFSPTAGDHITFPSLITIDVPGMIRAIEENSDIAPFVRRVAGDEYAVTGGQLGRIGDELYLVGGHRFDGRYNPMSMPTFRQEYTNQIRVFSIPAGDSPTHEVAPVVRLVRSFTDKAHLRRRDYNLVPQILPNGTGSYMVSSGVFQADADLPFLYPVEITADGYRPVPEFRQLLSNYHSAKLPLYDDETGEMHTIFFGGLAQYYYQDGSLIRDDLVPFVDTISRVTRSPDGTYREYALPEQMPGLVGTSGEFIPVTTFLHGDPAVFRSGHLSDGPVVVGHIVGGIRSPQANPFFSNRTHLTAADSSVYAVVLTRTETDHREVLDSQ